MGAKGLSYLDVGGGLGVDYDGSQTNFASSMNYTVQEYANDVVFAIKEICDADQVPHPNIVSESGRAIAAHHSVLVVNVLGVTEFNTHVPAQLAKPGAAARHQHVGDVPGRLARRTCSRAITTPSSTRTRSSSCSTSATSRSSTACSARTCSGRSARRS